MLDKNYIENKLPVNFTTFELRGLGSVQLIPTNVVELTTLVGNLPSPLKSEIH